MLNVGITVLILFCSVTFVTAQISKKYEAFPRKSSIWQTRRISVCWENPEPWNADLRAHVKASIENTWEKNSQLRFTDWCDVKQKNCDIHILIADRVPEAVCLGKHIKGKRNGIKLNFTFQNVLRECQTNKKFFVGTLAAHEFGHALGFAHEQNRADCDFDNCLGEPQGQNGDWFLTDCDNRSIMNYCSNPWLNKGELSPLDIVAVQHIYGKPMLDIARDSFKRLVSGPNKSLQKVPSKPSNRLGEYNFAHTSTPIGLKENSREFKVNLYLISEPIFRSEVKEIIYQLPQSFSAKTVVATSGTDLFALEMIIESEVEISGKIALKNGGFQPFKYFVSLHK